MQKYGVHHYTIIIKMMLFIIYISIHDVCLSVYQWSAFLLLFRGYVPSFLEVCVYEVIGARLGYLPVDPIRPRNSSVGNVFAK